MEEFTTERKEEMQLSEAAKAARRAYKRQWSKANPDKVKGYQQRYWERVAQAAIEEAGHNLTGGARNGKEYTGS